MALKTPSEGLEVEVNRAAHMGRVVERAGHIAALQQLLEEEDKKAVLATLQARGFRLEEGFEAKELPEIQEAIREAIGAMGEEQPAGLATAIEKGLVGASEDVPLDVEGYETQLEAAQIEWVREQVEAGYERSKVVNSPLIQLSDVPDFPSKEAAFRSARKQLTPTQVTYMMEAGRSPFSFGVKLVAPNNRLDLIHALLDGQPKRMDLRDGGKRQKDLSIYGDAERHLSSNGGNGTVEWKWSFYQGQQVIDEVEGWDNLARTTSKRKEVFKAQLPDGMKGTDRFDWALRMADGLESGRPLDIRFPGNATDTKEYETFHITILDEEGGLIVSGIHYLIGGMFNYGSRGPYVDTFFVNDRPIHIRFRASCDGVIEA